MPFGRTRRRHPLVALLAALAVLGPLATPATSDVTSVRQRIAGARAREQTLKVRVSGSSQVISALSSQLSLLGGRISDVQSLLAVDRTRLVNLKDQLTRQHLLAGKLARRFAVLRAALSRWLIGTYEDGSPDMITVVFAAHGFSDLLERMDYARRLSRAGASITAQAHLARDLAARALTRLAELTARQSSVTAQAAAESRALASMQTALADRRSALAQARQLELDQLQSTRAHRLDLQRQLSALLAPVAAPGAAPGSFVIPWAIVQCESGGQNLPPNSAGASGYYQILPSTWKENGGGTSQAYQASKAEQDQVASRIWAGGAGASNWACAALVHAG